jgi:hypothetical protein
MIEDCIVVALYADERDHVWQGIAASQVVTFLVVMQNIKIVVFIMLPPFFYIGCAWYNIGLKE